MRWMATGSVQLYGTNYSPEQSVSTDGWSQAQVQHQIYLGNIVPDTRLGSGVYNYSEGGSWTAIREEYLVSNSPPRVAFTAPSSGRALYLATVLVRGGSASTWIGLQPQLRTGGVPSQGDIVRTFTIDYWRGTDWHTAVMTGVSESLVPGNPYNLSVAIKSTAGGGDIGSGSRIWVTPLTE